MARIRKTVTLKLEIFNKIEELRGGKTFSTFLNNFLEDKLLEKKLKGGQKKKKNEQIN